MHLDIKKMTRAVEIGYCEGREGIVTFLNNGAGFNIKYVRDDNKKLIGFIFNRKAKIIFGKGELNRGRNSSRLFELALFYLNNYRLAERFDSYMDGLFKGPIPNNLVFEKTTPYNETFKLTIFIGEAKFGISRNGLDDAAAYCTCMLNDEHEIDRFRNTVTHLIRSAEMEFTHHYNDHHYVDELLDINGNFIITDKTINKLETIDDEINEEVEEDCVRCTFCERDFPRSVAPTFNNNALSGVYSCPECSVSMMEGLVDMFKSNISKQRKDFFKKG